MVLDADLDAPGVASMLAGHGGATAPWGIVDYLLERRVRGNVEPHIEDYYHQYAEAGVSGGEIHPSRRIEDLMPSYHKRVDGPVLAGRMGLSTIRAESRGFNEWVTRLESLNQR